MNDGWVKLWRKSIYSPLWKNHNAWRLFEYCLLKATMKPYSAIVGYQKIDLLPGQFIFGRELASEETGLSVQSVRTSLKFLEKTENLTIKVTNKFSIITVVNWNTYQSAGVPANQQSNQQVTIKQPSSNHIQEENKNKKNKKKQHVFSEAFLRFWAAYPKKDGKKPAWASWQKKAFELPIEQILSAIKNQSQSEQWKKDGGQFIPLPATWLNQERWEDEGTKTGGQTSDLGAVRARLKEMGIVVDEEATGG